MTLHHEDDMDVEKHASGLDKDLSTRDETAESSPDANGCRSPADPVSQPPSSSSTEAPTIATRVVSQAMSQDLNEPPPDGGLTAWLQVVAAILVNTMTWGYAAAFGVFQLYYVEALNLPSSQISWIGSMQVFLTYATCVFSGRLADAGYCRESLAAGTFLAVLGTFMTSLAHTYWQIFLAQGVCIGVGLGVAFMPAITVVSSYFQRRRSFAISLSACGTAIGSVSFPAAVQYLTPRIGFPWAVRCVGLIVLVISVVVNILLKPRLIPRKSGPLFDWTAFRNLPYLFFALGSFLYYYALYFVLFYINSFARNVIGFSTLESINLLLITNAMGIPARPIGGYIADRFVGPLNIFTFTTIILSVLIYSWIGVSTRGGMYAFSVVYGLAAGTNQGSFVAALASMNKDPRKLGIRFGMVQALGSFATVAGAPTAGAIIDRSDGRYFWAQIWGGTIMAMAFFVYLASRMTYTRGKLWVKV